ncbi:hypothetical protein F4780DRAFT_423386 [Xylariomycetidae sp. FL0641]|nr:hypothetical protein F4780DRAFT_423386 [Xylariomycetidae sp. FL0641]
MTQGSLTRRDFNVLEKIKDPEANPTAAILVDPSLPKDPNVTDEALYERVAQKEREIVLAMQQLEMQLAGLKPGGTLDPIDEYQRRVADLDQLVSECPRYASARNNRAQALRRLYGDAMLLPGHKDADALIPDAADAEKGKAGDTALLDLDEAIALLTPKSLFASISPQAGKTLAMAHTQRAALYHMTAKSFQGNVVALASERKEASWTKLDFEAAASRDFALGGRYGNEIAKGLAVSTNPTAKLCGQMVREAMKKEYGPAFSA